MNVQRSHAALRSVLTVIVNPVSPRNRAGKNSAVSGKVVNGGEKYRRGTSGGFAPKTPRIYRFLARMAGNSGSEVLSPPPSRPRGRRSGRIPA